MQNEYLAIGAFVVAIAIFSAGTLIANAINRLHASLLNESQRLIARFCDFAFEPRDGDSSRWIAELSHMRKIEQRLAEMVANRPSTSSVAPASD